jgi:cytochrome c-type biogenesis protein CcmH
VTLSVRISPALKAKLGANDVLYVFAKAAEGPPMPLAVHRGPAAELANGPLSVTLSDANAMMPTMKLSMFSNVLLGARISKSGLANAQSGDFQVLTGALKQPITGPITLEISDVLP